MPKYSSQENTGPNLSDVTETGRKVVKYAVVTLVSYMLLTVIAKGLINYWRATHPEPPPAPTVGFGKLPQIKFSEEKQDITWPELEFSLTSEDYNELQAVDRVKVFQVYEPALSLLADDKARGIAQSYGFSDEPEILNSNLYRWYQYEPLEKVLELELDSFNYTISSDYLTRTELVGSPRAPEKGTAIGAIKNYLNRGSDIPADLADAEGEATYLRSLAGQLMPAVSLSDATIVEVSINRSPIDEKFNFYTSNNNQGILHGFVTNAFGSNTVVDFSYAHYSLDYENAETYPIKTLKEAVEELQNGQAYLASADPNKNLPETVTIRKIRLGFLDIFEYQPYVQPIWVFMGDEGFLAYVSAVHDSYVQVN